MYVHISVSDPPRRNRLVRHEDSSPSWEKGPVVLVDMETCLDVGQEDMDSWNWISQNGMF